MSGLSAIAALAIAGALVPSLAVAQAPAAYEP
ncbi:MAG: hypothetical protein JWQ13_3270, partial [Ramlibacter sp.]|nr:hypothetical protein [Ramlibacter sp.]